MRLQGVCMPSVVGSGTLREAPVTPVVSREYPTTADAYELLEEAGRGVSATVIEQTRA